MRLDNLIIMPNRAPNPESVPALRKEIRDLAASFNEFKKSLDGAKKPSLWGRLETHPIWSAVIAGLIIALIVWVGSIVKGDIYTLTDSYVDGRAAAITGPMQKQITSIDERTSRIEGEISGLQLRQLSSTPSDPKSIAGAKTILETAKRSAIKIPTDVVEQSGKAFIDAASKEPAAWDAAIRFVEYRSALNVTLNVIPSPNAQKTTTVYGMEVPPGSQPPQLTVAGLISKDQAARLNPIGGTVLTDTTLGNQWIIATGGGLSLDGYAFKNVLFVNVHIAYKGEPLQMENVYFVNCTFDFVRNAHAQEIANSILSSPSISTTIS